MAVNDRPAKVIGHADRLGRIEIPDNHSRKSLADQFVAAKSTIQRRRAVAAWDHAGTYLVVDQFGRTEIRTLSPQTSLQLAVSRRRRRSS